MLKKFRLEHPFLFAVCIYLTFFVTMNATGWVCERVCELFVGGPVPASFDPFNQIISELAPALVLCLVLFGTGRLGLLKKRGRGFFAGLAIGGACLAYIAWLAFQQIVIGLTEYGTINIAAPSIALVVSMLMVGVTEEIEARALIGETFLEHFGTERSGAIKAAALSGLIFGAMHLTNAINGDLTSTLVQVATCATSGFLYGAVYFRGGNIWSIALIHGLNDVAASLATVLFLGGVELEQAAVATESLSIASFAYPAFIGILDIVLALYLLRPRKAGEVKQSWPEIPADGAKPETLGQAA